MLLGLSGAGEAGSTDHWLVAGSDQVDGGQGVPEGPLLTRFAERVHDADGVEEVRVELVDALGPAATVDAAGVCANFTMMVRIADGTGTPLDHGSVEPSSGFRSELGLDDLPSSRFGGRQGD